MRDQALTIAEAAKWLGCSEDAVGDLLKAGQLRSYDGPGAKETALLSLNSVVVLAESLPAEQGLFHVREMPSQGDGGSERSRTGGPDYRSAGAVVERRNRPPVIVEHRNPRPRLRQP